MKIKNTINNRFSVPVYPYSGMRRTMFLTILITLCILTTIHPLPSNDHRITNLNDQLLSNPTEWIICGPTSWEDLKTYLPEAKMAGISVSVILIPPFQSTLVCTEGTYSEPFGNDYIRWAEEIAKLSLRYSNLISYGIDDLKENVNQGYLSQDYLDQIINAGKSINPKLHFNSLYNIWYVSTVSAGDSSANSWANKKNICLFDQHQVGAGDTVYIDGGTDSLIL